MDDYCHRQTIFHSFYVNLSYVNLSYVNLSYVNLSYVNLSYVNLSYFESWDNHIRLKSSGHWQTGFKELG